MSQRQKAILQLILPTLIGAALGGLSWAAGARAAQAVAPVEQRVAALEARSAATDRRLDEIREDLRYVRRRVDEIAGGRGSSMSCSER